jgi:type I restriction enzyme, R subunit
MIEYTEDKLVEQTAVEVFKDELHYSNLNCFHEKFPETLGRQTNSEVVLIDRLSKAIDLINENVTSEEKQQVIDEVIKDRSRLSLVKANQEVYKLIRSGVKIKLKTGKQDDFKTIKIINLDDHSKNDYFCTTQLWISGEIYKRRPDIVCFVNGLPLILIEFKARGVNVKKAFDNNLADYKDTIPHLFWYNAFIIISNGRDTKIGSLTSQYEHFAEWKKINEENEQGLVSLDTVLKGTCEKSKFLDLLENFILFTTLDGSQIKILAKNHQYLGVNAAVNSFKNRKKNHGRLGVYWHTQGSGKSYSMIFFTQKILRKIGGDYTFVVVTDRHELDNQIYQNFQNAGVVTEKNVQAKNGNHLKQLLQEDHRLIFTLIHKFNVEKDKIYPKLTDRDDVVVLTDEAHRSQYDILANNMRNALPNASFIGFTGTPLMIGEEKTKDTFGDYVSIYNFRDSIDDHATVSLYYENRVPELQLINPTINEDLYDVIEESELDEQQEDKLSREFSKEYHLITNEDRLNAISEDIVNHFVSRGYDGKAMVVSVDKLTTVKMYDKVQYNISEYTKRLSLMIEKKKDPVEKYELEEKLNSLQNLDMAVVVSSEQNEIKKFKNSGLDIKKHRKRMNDEDLATLFKNPKSKFQIVFVCNMWMTGFDVPALSTIYLDKPMKNHSLMQAISRANRVFGDKPAGFIVDYINVFRDLKKALAIYATSRLDDMDLPIESKDELVKGLRDYIKELEKFLLSNNIDHEKIIKSEKLEKNALLDNALSNLVINDAVKKDFITKARNAVKIFKAILPHPSASEFRPFVALCQDLIKEILSLNPDVDIETVLGDVRGVLDKSISSKGYVIDPDEKNKILDISKIDFKSLEEKFRKKKNNTDIERLKNILSYKVKDMVRLNNTRVDYQEKLQKLIDEYNSGSITQEIFFEELLNLSNDLNEEDRRKLVEDLTEEELALFDKLKKSNLSDADKNRIKKVAKSMLDKLQPGKLVLDWKKKQQTRAAVKLEIEKTLDSGLPEIYTSEDYENKCSIIFQHFYDNYPGDGITIYNN